MSEMEKVNVAIKSAYRLLHPMHTVLVSCVGKTGKPNIITLAWAMPTSIDPPLVAIGISPRRHSYALIEKTQEFVVNIPAWRYWMKPGSAAQQAAETMTNSMKQA